MKENSIKIIEEKIKALDLHIQNYETADCKTSVYDVLQEERNALVDILQDYKRVLKENEELKTELKDSVIAIKLYALQTENEKQKKLIEKMKKYLLKENKMCDFLESEE